jgi:ribosomal protein S18 acetylase RimI-like enzyme
MSGEIEKSTNSLTSPDSPHPFEPIVFRRVAPEDRDAIFQYFESMSEATKAIFLGAPFNYEEATRLTDDELKNETVRKFLVRVSGSEAVVGMVWFWAWDRKVPWFGISITDAYQGKGLGGKMMEFAIGEAKQAGKGGILLTTAKSNLRGQALYKRYGYEIIGEATQPKGEHLMILNFPD